MSLLLSGVDASTPGAALPVGTSILAAYIGEPGEPGQPDTPHIWTAAEWNSYITPNPELRLLPIYVHNFPGDPTDCANNAADAAYELGWKPGIGRLIALDIETLVNQQYVSEFASALAKRGFTALLYGSDSTVFHNKYAGPVWTALLASHRPGVLPPMAVGQQWRFGPDWDLNVFGEYVLANCGVGQRDG